MSTSISPFRRRDDDPLVTKVGFGSPGGKALGLARLEQRVLPCLDRDGLDNITLDVPRAVTLCTGVYDAFIEHNRLHDLAEETDAEVSAERADERVRSAFAKAELPPLVVGDLRALLEYFREPLAIRSSSLLEDALAHPFAGVYGTKMIPNNAVGKDTRFKQLLDAIKFVYATTVFRNARSYLRALPRDPPEEKMALVVQRVVGRSFGRRYYPCASVVARSFNYYATGHAEPEDGVVDIALGLGKTIVDGGRCWSYCPAYPTAPPPTTIGTLLDNGQREFWALDLDARKEPSAMREAEFLIMEELRAAEEDGVLALAASSYDAGADRLVPGLRDRGARLVNFAPLLACGDSPLNEAIKRLLRATETEYGHAVELELAVDWDPRAPDAMRLCLLQARAMAVSAQAARVEEDELDAPGVVVGSGRAMGNGERNDITHVVYLKPGAFDPARSRAIASEVCEHNARLRAQRRVYALVGFGRWGSSDPWLGVPVEWSDISGARVIVEATLPTMNTELSQGSHFFHNMISFGVLYLSLRHELDRSIDWDFLDGLDAVAESAHVRVVECPQPLSARVDGRSRRGVLRRPIG